MINLQNKIFLLNFYLFFLILKKKIKIRQLLFFTVNSRLVNPNQILHKKQMFGLTPCILYFLIRINRINVNISIKVCSDFACKQYLNKSHYHYGYRKPIERLEKFALEKKKLKFVINSFKHLYIHIHLYSYIH